MKTEIQKFGWLDVPKAIWYFLAEDRKKFLLAFSTLTVVFLYDLVPPYMVGKIVDFFTNYQKGDSLGIFYFFVIFTAITWIVASYIRLKSKNILGILRLHARARARIWGFERLTEFSMEWHNKENTGNKLQRIFTGAEAVVGWIRMLQKDLLRIFIKTVGIIVFFVFADIKILILIICHIAVFFSVSTFFSKRILKFSNEFNKLNQAAAGTYVESSNNMLAIKALGGKEQMVNRVEDRETVARDISIAKINSNNLKWRIFQVINGVALGAFLYLVGMGFVEGSISIGSILIFYTYFDKLGAQIADLDELYFEMIDLRADLAHMMPIFRETEFIKTGNAPFPKNWQSVELKNVVMDYGSGQMGLKDFNLILKKNSKTGVAGLSGSGKSTLAKIILGLYAIKSGSIKIGDKDYYSIAHNETLNNITVVLQETELFNLSLRDNITMMRSGNQELLEKAVEISQLKDVINKLPEGLDSRIGEKGYMLSGGERQRLGIARAVYKNASIMLLDEATSSLDSETEAKIMANLLGEYGKDKTFLIIAHRLGTLKYTDKIAVMEEGKVIEEGSYDQLMNNTASVFYRLNSQQKQK